MMKKLNACLLLLLAFLFNSKSIANLASLDGEALSLPVKVFIWVIQGLFLLVGLWLLKNRRDIAGKRVTNLFFTVFFVFLCGIGGFAHFKASDHFYAAENQPLKSFAELCEWLTSEDAPFVGKQDISYTQNRLNSVVHNPESDALQLIRARSDHAFALLRHGGASEAVVLLEAAYKQAIETGQSQSDLNKIRRQLGITFLRGGEVSQCIEQNNPQSCLLPLKEGGIWRDTERAEKAIAQFTDFLEFEPDKLAVIWLLNLSYMVAGAYPASVPDKWLIPESSFASEAESNHFLNIAGELGIDTINLVGGIILDDFDNDGHVDIITSSFMPCDTVIYFHNNGDGSFVDWSHKSGLSQQFGGFNLVQTDYNNDGLLDVMILRGAWMGDKFGLQQNSLLRQEPNGSFTDVSIESGLGADAFPTLAAMWFDYDNDGDLDVFVGNEGFEAQLFRNDMGKTFTDVSKSAGISNNAIVKGLSWGDYDNDGDGDLYISNISGEPNKFFRNNGDGSFTDIAGKMNLDLAGRTFGCWFWDYNNDGWLDLFVAGFSAQLGEVASNYLGNEVDAEPLRLFKNDQNGGFVDVSKAVGLHDIRLPMGANYGDIDNDGFPDIYLGTGKPAYDFLVPNVMYRNINGQSFSDVTSTAGVGHLQKGHGVAFADIDNDGDQDIFAQMGGFYPADAFQNALFENQGNANNWLRLSLKGATSNRAAIGARLKVTTESDIIHTTVGPGGSFGASTLRVEIGLGNAKLVNELEIWWPTSNLRQKFSKLSVNQFIEIAEDKDDYRVLLK